MSTTSLKLQQKINRLKLSADVSVIVTKEGGMLVDYYSELPTGGKYTDTFAYVRYDEGLNLKGFYLTEDGTTWIFFEGADITLGETSTTAGRGDYTKAAYDHSQLTSGNPHNTSKSDVGLGNVDNTSDVNKPISTATQSALDLKIDESLNDYTPNRLYNWYAVNSGKLAPTGWRVANNTDWFALQTYLGGVNSGGKMKETGLIHWNTPNEGATNESGFTAIGNGNRIFNGIFEAIKQVSYWWSSTEYDATNGNYFYNSYVSEVFDNSYDTKNIGFSVRCVRDTDPGASTITDADGNVYDVLTIGTQYWLKQDLKTTKYNDNTIIPHIIDNSTWVADTSGAYSDYTSNVVVKDSYSIYTLEENIERFTPTLEAKLNGIEAGAEVNIIETINVNTTPLTVTGKAVNIDLTPYQLIANFASDVRATVLTGLSLATNQTIAATDTILQAFGYLQKQITDAVSSLSGYFLLAGRSGGQTAIGGNGTGEKLILKSTSHATRGGIEIGDSTVGENLTVFATLGAELAPALTGNSGANWTVGTGWETPLNNTLNKNTDGTGTATPTSQTITAGVTYKVVITFSTFTTGTVGIYIGGTPLKTISAAGTYTEYITAFNTSKLILTPSNLSRFTITSVSTMALTENTGDITLGGDLYISGNIKPRGNTENAINVTRDYTNILNVLRTISSNAGANIAISSFLNRSNTSGDSVNWSMYTNGAVSPDFFGKIAFTFQGGTNDVNKQFQIFAANAATPKVVVNGSGYMGVGITVPLSQIDNNASEGRKVTTITGNTTLDGTHNVVLCNSTGVFTVTLPAASGITNRQYIIKNINTGVITVDANASETIDGDLTVQLNQYEGITIITNGSNWFII